MHRLWDRGSLSFPLLKFMSVFFLVEKKDEKRREKRNLHVLRHEEKYRLDRPWEGEGLFACPSLSPFRQEHNLERRGAVAFLSFYSLRKRKYRKK